MPKVQFLGASTAGHPFRKGHLYRDESTIYLFKRRGAGNGGCKKLVFEVVATDHDLISSTRRYFSYIPTLEEISVEDLPLYVGWTTKCPAFNRLMKEN